MRQHYISLRLCLSREPISIRNNDQCFTMLRTYCELICRISIHVFKVRKTFGRFTLVLKFMRPTCFILVIWRKLVSKGDGVRDLWTALSNYNYSIH